MNFFQKTFLIFILSYVLFSLSYAYPQNCDYSSDGYYCNQCLPGYYNDSTGNCTCNIPNCDNCTLDGNNNTICQNCSLYFGIQSSDASSCKSCYIDGCSNCSLDSQGQPICYNCSESYYFDNGKCLSCSDTISGCWYCNGSKSCTTCIEKFYWNGSECIECGSDDKSAHCMVCYNDNWDGSVYCGYCKYPYFLDVSYGDSLCTSSCDTLIPNCEECENSYKCYTCQSGYNNNHTTNKCEQTCQNITNCSYCPGGGDQCTICKPGYFMNFNISSYNSSNGTNFYSTPTGNCILCSDISAVQKNCAKPSCHMETYAYSGSYDFKQTCDKCNDGYTKSNTLGCYNCSDQLANCEICGEDYDSNGVHPSCSKCKSGYYLQYLDNNATSICVQSCNNKTVLNNFISCLNCSEIYGDFCGTCNSSQCLTCNASSIYLLLNMEKNKACSSCSDNNEYKVMMNNQTLCLRTTMPTLLSFNNTNNSSKTNITFNISCGVNPFKIYFVYGPASLVQTLTLTDVSSKVGNKNTTNIPSTSDNGWLGYGSKKSNGTSFIAVQLIPPFKNAGDNYQLTIWCKNLLNSTDANSLTKTWIQPNNGGQKTKISIITNSKLTSAQKKSLGYAVKKTLKISRDMYTDEGDLVPSQISSNRLLQSTNSTVYSTSFVVVPDYSIPIDNSAVMIAQALLNYSGFLSSVNSILTNLSTNSFQVSSINSTIFASISIVPIITSVTVTPNGDSINILFNVSNANGTFLAGVEPSAYGIQQSSLSSLSLNYPSWNQFALGLNYSSVALSHFVNTSFTTGSTSSITISGLDNNKTYLVYYGAIDDQFPPDHSGLYINVTTTLTSNINSSSSTAFCFSGLILLVLMILFN